MARRRGKDKNAHRLRVKEVKRAIKSGALAFVVQKHKARALHYDLRLEVGGVMPSWSIPKGPSLDSGVRRLAMQTPDHSMEYRHFEGVGAGPVMVWDEGTYSPEVEVSKGVRRKVVGRAEADEVAGRSLKEGVLKFFLRGKKLRGSFALVRTRFGGRESWLLIKHRDEFCRPGYDANDYLFSAVSGKTLEQIASEGEWKGQSQE